MKIGINNKKLLPLIEMLERVKLSNLHHLKQEDNKKRKRLKILYKIIGVKYEKVYEAKIYDILNQTEVFKKISNQLKNGKCSFRIIPTKRHFLPKYRLEETNIKQGVKWLNNLKIKPKYYKNYEVEIIPHNYPVLYSMIMVINDFGIFGEFIKGEHWQLTQGILKNKLMTTSFDFKNYYFSHQTKVKKTVKKIINQLKITDTNARRILRKKIKAQFTKKNYLKGYFEIIIKSPTDIMIMDYNRVLGKKMQNFISSKILGKIKLIGTRVNCGVTKGKISIINKPKQQKIKTDDAILVCKNLSVDYLPLLSKIKGIITEEGNRLSHLAIVGRELKKPYITNVKNATKILKNNQKVILNANDCTISLL